MKKHVHLRVLLLVLSSIASELFGGLTPPEVVTPEGPQQLRKIALIDGEPIVGRVVSYQEGTLKIIGEDGSEHLGRLHDLTDEELIRLFPKEPSVQTLIAFNDFRETTAALIDKVQATVASVEESRAKQAKEAIEKVDHFLDLVKQHSDRMEKLEAENAALRGENSELRGLLSDAKRPPPQSAMQDQSTPQTTRAPATVVLSLSGEGTMRSAPVVLDGDWSARINVAASDGFAYVNALNRSGKYVGPLFTVMKGGNFSTFGFGAGTYIFEVNAWGKFTLQILR